MIRFILVNNAVEIKTGDEDVLLVYNLGKRNEDDMSCLCDIPVCRQGLSVSHHVPVNVPKIDKLHFNIEILATKYFQFQ